MAEVLEFLKSHLGELLLGLALLLSEVLGSMDRFKSSSIFQMVVAFLKGLKEESPPPPAP